MCLKQLRIICNNQLWVLDISFSHLSPKKCKNKHCKIQSQSCQLQTCYRNPFQDVWSLQKSVGRLSQMLVKVNWIIKICPNHIFGAGGTFKARSYKFLLNIQKMKTLEHEFVTKISHFAATDKTKQIEHLSLHIHGSFDSQTLTNMEK